MFSPEGNNAAEAAFQTVKRDATNRRTLNSLIKTAMEAVKVAGHGEIGDTEPEWEMCYRVNAEICEPEGWKPVSRWDW